jgi:hypothetical protein
MGLDFFFSLLIDEDEERGDWWYEYSLGEPEELSYPVRAVGGRCVESCLDGAGFGWISRRFVLRSSFWDSLFTKLYRAGFLSFIRRCAVSSPSEAVSSKTSFLAN